MPLLSNAAGDRLILQYSRIPVTGFRKEGPNPTLPPPSEKRLEAMAAIEDLAWKNALVLPRQPGDIAYFNNMCLMHARHAFDLDINENPLPSKRHLVKMVLQDPELRWETPDCLRSVSEHVYGPNRANGGRAEKWQMTISDPSVTDGKMWIGAGGSTANG